MSKDYFNYSRRIAKHREGT